MTIADAIKKKMREAEGWAAESQVGIGTGAAYNDPNFAGFPAARDFLLARNDTYKVLDELLQLAEGKITDVSDFW